MQALFLFNILKRRISTDFTAVLRELTLLGVSILITKSMINLFCERRSGTINHNNLSLQKMSIRRMQRSWPTLMKRSKFPCRLRASFNWTRFHWNWIMLWRTFCWESWSNLFWACLSKSNIAEFHMSTLVNIKNCLLNITKAKKCKNLQ